MNVFSHFKLVIGSSVFDLSGTFTFDTDVKARIREFYDSIAPATAQLQAMAARLNTQSTDVTSALDSEAAT